MKKQKILSLIFCVSMVFSGCASGSIEVTAATPAASGTMIAATDKETTVLSGEASVFSNRDLDASYSEADCIQIALNGSEIACDSDSVDISGTTATIQKEGTYLLSGTLEDGRIIVDADKADKIRLILKGVSIHSETSAPIYVRQVDKVFVTLAEGSQNILSDGGSFAPDGDTNIDAVLFSREDLTLNGSGALSITSTGGHGIVSKDSLRITGGSYTIDAAAHGLSGKDEVSIASGIFDIIAGKDGIHGENSEDEELGSVYLENGTYRISAGGDGISASGSCRIADGDYTITAGGGRENGQQENAKLPFDRGGFGPSMDAIGSAPSQAERPQNFPERGGNRQSGKGFDSMNQKQDTRQEEAQTDSVSTKGIKAADLTIDGGSYTIDSADDGLHAGGELTLRGGTLEIASGDDGLHADETVTVVSGSLNIVGSYEGIEGKHVAILGGDITLNATDDGLNAAGGRDGSGFGARGDAFTQSGDTPSIVISGGTVRITASGDGIDANGTLEITGGTVTVSGPTYGDTSVLDFDITGTISGGTFIGTGASNMAQTFSDSTQGVISVKVGQQTGGTTVTLTDGEGTVILSHTPELDYEIVIFSSPSVISGKSYTLRVGDAAQSFTAQ